MPTFNRGYIIETAVRSVLAQTVDDFELIIVDDGSIDDTESVIERVGDRRVRFVSQENRGAAAARNRAVTELATGKWIAYLDSDNELFPEYLETMLRFVEGDRGAVFAIPRARRTLELYEDGVLTCMIDDSADTPERLSLRDIFMKRLHLDTNGFMHLRSLFVNDGIRWDEQCRAMEDWELAMTIGEQYPEGFRYVPVVLCAYHQRFGGDGIVSSLTYGDWAEVFEHIYRRHEHSQMLEGQDWYPQRVDKWRRLQDEFDRGLLPPYTKYYFRERLAMLAHRW